MKKNKKEKKAGKRKISKVLIIILVILLVIAATSGGVGYWYCDKLKKEYEQDIKDLETILEEAFLDYEGIIEYGSVWSYDDFLDSLIKHDKLGSTIKVELKVNDEVISSNNDYTFSKLGENSVKLTISDTYQYKVLKNHVRDLKKYNEYNFKVEDTVFPVIEGVSDKTITVGDEINLKEGITAHDEVDGELEINIDGEVDSSKAGTYKIVVYAVDTNNNRVEKEFTVKVNEKKTTTNTTTKPNNSNTGTSNNSTNTNTNQNNTQTNTNDASTVAGRLSLAKIEAKRVVAEIIMPGMSDYDKAYAIFKYLHYNVSLQTNQSTEAYKTNYGNEAYAALIMKIAACSGFCKAVTLLCNEAGLQSQHINANQWTHQWNKVLIDGEWIILDAQGGIFGGTTHILEN